MKKGINVALICLAIFAVSFGTTGLIVGTGDAKADAIDNNIISTLSEKPEIITADKTMKTEYILRNYDGHIGIFYGEFDKVPAIETDIQVSTLREIDQKLLEDGIRADSYEEILKLLEDFNS